MVVKGTAERPTAAYALVGNKKSKFKMTKKKTFAVLVLFAMTLGHKFSSSGHFYHGPSINHEHCVYHLANITTNLYAGPSHQILPWIHIGYTGP